MCAISPLEKIFHASILENLNQNDFLTAEHSVITDGLKAIIAPEQSQANGADDE